MKNVIRAEYADFAFGINSTVITNLGYMNGEYGESLVVTYANDYKEYIPNKVSMPVEFGSSKLITDLQDPTLRQAREEIDLKLIDLVTAYVPREEWNLAYKELENKTPGTEPTFKDSVELIITLIKSSSTYVNKQPIDVFCRLKHNDPTDVEIPKNGKHGVIYTPHVKLEGKKWTNSVEKGLLFKDEGGNTHPIKRKKGYHPNFYKLNLETPKSTGITSDDLPF